MRHDSAGSLVHNQRSSPCVDISVLIGRWLLEKRCCISEAFVWRDRSESGVSTVGDLTCSIHPETQESTEPQYTFHKRFWNICNVLQGSSNGTWTNATPYVPKTLGLFLAPQIVCSDYRSFHKEYSYVSNSKDCDRPCSHVVPQQPPDRLCPDI